MDLKNILSFIKPDEKRTCKKCGAEKPYKAFKENMMICPDCGAYLRMNAYERIELIADENSFMELDSELKSENIIDFPDSVASKTIL